MSSPAVRRGGRRTGRILSLGVPLPGPRVDNYNLLTAPSFFDYDALIVDIQSTAQLIEGVAAGTADPETFGRKRVRKVAESPDDVALADVLARRSDETARLLANTGVIAVFAQPPVTLRGVEGTDGLSSYWWLPSATGIEYEHSIISADGTQAHVVDYQHAMAPFLLGQLANVSYRARVDVEAMPSFAERGRVFARSYGGAAIGVELAVGGGKLVLLPALKSVPSGDARYALSDSLQACLRRMLGVMAEGREPGWLGTYALPGLDVRAGALADARARLREAQHAADAAEDAHTELARYQALLWQEGTLGLDPAVTAALRLVGFEVYGANPDELEIRCGDAAALVEIDARDGAVGMAAHYRLRQRIERAIERRASAPRGVIIVNGHRLRPPGERPQQASDALRLAAETMRYCVATTASLFEAVRTQLSGDAAAVEAFRHALLSTDGLLEATPLA
jgi:hypothetical protein